MATESRYLVFPRLAATAGGIYVGTMILVMILREPPPASAFLEAVLFLMLPIAVLVLGLIVRRSAFLPPLVLALLQVAAGSLAVWYFAGMIDRMIPPDRGQDFVMLSLLLCAIANVGAGLQLLVRLPARLRVAHPAMEHLGSARLPAPEAESSLLRVVGLVAAILGLVAGYSMR